MEIRKNRRNNSNKQNKQNKQSRRSLKGLFLEFIIVAGISIICVSIFYVLLLELTVSSGLVIPANEQEMEVKAIIAEIQQTDCVNVSEFPKGLQYAIFDKNNQQISASMTDNNLEIVQQLLSEQSTSYSRGVNQVMLLEADSKKVAFAYSITSRFRSDTINKIFPNNSILFLLAGIILLVTDIVAVSWIYAGKLSRKVALMKQAADNIMEQDLEFKVRYTGIREFDAVMHSLENLKENLADSLAEQWAIQQQQKEQMSALAHDIKTPLTIINGNAELLDESQLTEEQKEFTGYIINNAEQIKNYITQLIEISKAGSIHAVKKQIRIQDFITNVSREVLSITKVKNNELLIENHIEKNDLQASIKVDMNLLLRAILNIVANAAEISKENDNIILGIFTTESSDGSHYLNIRIEDFGPGFSEEALKHAHEQFYRGNPTRNSDSHFGMGLYIAENISRLHHGGLTIENKMKTNGAQVTIYILMNYN